MDANFSLNRKIRTRAERLEEEQKKQEELMQKQREIAVEKARLLKRYMLVHAAEQENSKTDARIVLGKHNNTEIKPKIIEEEKEELKKDAENILTILNKIKLSPGKKKVIKHYMLNKLGDSYK
jgi:predicted transcriptional regulator